MTPEEENWLALSLVEGLGPKTMSTLLRRFGSVERILSADATELTRNTGMARDLANRVANAREVRAIQIEKRLIDQHGVGLTTIESDQYPELLRETMVPPPLLYHRGKFPASHGLHLAVVGTRSNTRYGEKITRRLITELADAQPDTVIVSGLARGIDTIAHQQALECGLRTVAVLAGGLSKIYPPENEALAESITGQGALVTEFHMAQPPLAKHFPIRNRIIGGLCSGVLVVEAGERSGALITAGFGLHYDREVFAVPGNIDAPNSQGTNRLIQQARAKLVRTASDMLEELELFRRPRERQMDLLGAGDAVDGKKRTAGSPEKETIFSALEKGPLHADDLSQELELPVERLLGLLLELELAGDIYQTADNLYTLS